MAKSFFKDLKERLKKEPLLKQVWFIIWTPLTVPLALAILFLKTLETERMLHKLERGVILNVLEGRIAQQRVLELAADNSMTEKEKLEKFKSFAER